MSTAAPNVRHVRVQSPSTTAVPFQEAQQKYRETKAKKAAGEQEISISFEVRHEADAGEETEHTSPTIESRPNVIIKRPKEKVAADNHKDRITVALEKHCPGIFKSVKYIDIDTYKASKTGEYCGARKSFNDFIAAITPLTAEQHIAQDLQWTTDNMSTQTDLAPWIRNRIQTIQRAGIVIEPLLSSRNSKKSTTYVPLQEIVNKLEHSRYSHLSELWKDMHGAFLWHFQEHAKQPTEAGIVSMINAQILMDKIYQRLIGNFNTHFKALHDRDADPSSAE